MLHLVRIARWKAAPGTINSHNPPCRGTSKMDERYDPKKIEPHWQSEWERQNLYLTRETPGRPKYYVLEMFPYPSGAGLSVGHLHNYVPCDVIGRYKRMAGFNVLHPMGWDAFGLPAENEALLRGRHPTETVPQYAANFKRQLTISGCAYDWTREINSSSPEYYKWTQWFFLLLYKRGLAYRATGAQWWCDECHTILANEQVVNGCCWRHTDTPVTKKDLEQWHIRITEYADRMLEDLDAIDWPEPIKLMQRNWIGRSEGAELSFPVSGHASAEVKFFTTRPDTVFGVSFMVLAPEHPLVAEITTPAQRDAVEAYVAQARRQSEIERMSTVKEKTGVFTGAYARNLFTNRDIPIWIADYVLMGYGTGAIMAAPGEDQRDFEFAMKYGLEIPRVTAPANGSSAQPDRAFTEHGIAVNSGFLDGMTTIDAIRAVCKYAQEHEIGRPTVSYRMRDWNISRQRYWGCPIPIVYCKAKCGIVPVPDDQLPVRLPAMKEYQPSGTGRSPLANVPEFVNTTCPKCGGPAERETDTLDGFACSSWYFLRFASPRDDAAPFDRKAVDYWLPVDLYVGGAEHAVMHLLYARMWTKVMFDAGMISFKEPFPMLRNQGMVWAADGQKMSKSKGNVVTPDAMIEKYGADALRLWELFMGPFDEPTNWNESGVAGTQRYLTRVWTMVRRYSKAGCPEAAPSDEVLRATHKTIATVTDHIERMRFNTALAALMEHLNAIAKLEPAALNRFVIESYVLMLSPMAPYVGEELWRALGHQTSVHLESWPAFDEAMTREDTVTVVVQVNGKVRDRLQVPAGSGEEQVRALALASEAVQRHLGGKPPRKFIYVPNKMLSIVV
jgi:leucyl-tRNA synthetase